MPWAGPDCLSLSSGIRGKLLRWGRKATSQEMGWAHPQPPSQPQQRQGACQSLRPHCSGNFRGCSFCLHSKEMSQGLKLSPRESWSLSTEFLEHLLASPATVPGSEDPEGHGDPLLMQANSKYADLGNKRRPLKGEPGIEDSWSKDWTQVSCIIGRSFTLWATREAQRRTSRGYLLSASWSREPATLTHVRQSQRQAGCGTTLDVSGYKRKASGVPGLQAGDLGKLERG